MLVLQSGWSTESGKTLVGLFTDLDKVLEYIQSRNDKDVTTINEYTITQMQPNINKVLFTEIWRMKRGRYYRYTTRLEWERTHGEQEYRID